MRIFAFTIILLITNIVIGQTEAKHPIDVELQNCRDTESNQTPFGRIECEHIAADLWDNELNNYYNDLMKRINTKEQEILKESQRKWIEYRDKELNFSETFYFGFQGTMWGTVAAGRRCDIIRSRALELKAYMDVLKMDESR
jgi:uncharacterized protein YecT (DUF1311 family)